MSAETNQTQEIETAEVKHETTLFAEPIKQVGGFTITNSLINTWLSVLILVILLFAAGRKVKKIPRGVQNIFEFAVEYALNFADTITRNRRKSTKFMPMVLAVFLFILVNNWMGLIPGVGTIGFIEQEEGHRIFVPLFRGATADINTTVALAILGVFATHLVGIFSVGAWKHFNKFLNLKAFLDIPGKIAKDRTIVLVNPIKAFVGVVEVVGEVSKVASLSLRLFGNIFAGEVLIASIMAITAFLVPIPFMFLEILVGFIQAIIFSTLILVFMTINSEAEEH